MHTISLRLSLVAGLALSLGACTTITLPAEGGGTVTTPMGNTSIIDGAGTGTAATTPGMAAPTTPAYTAPAATTAATHTTAPQGGTLTGLNLQAGAFSQQASAERVAADIRSKAPALAGKVFVAPRGDIYRVVIGPFDNAQARQSAADTIRSTTGKEVVNAAP